MKTRLIILCMMALVALATASTVIAYCLGYRHGGDAERACWTLDPVPTSALAHGEITARRNTARYPFLKDRLDPKPNPGVNSVERLRPDRVPGSDL